MKEQCSLTVSGDIQLDEVLKILDVLRDPLDFVVAEAQLSQLGKPEEILWEREGVVSAFVPRKLKQCFKRKLTGIKAQSFTTNSVE